MKKILILICVVTIIIVSMIFSTYTEVNRNKNEIKKINNEFLLYKNSDIQINTIVSLMNKAIQLNKDNKISQDEKLNFVENDNNSIKLYLETKSSKGEIVKIPMEELILNDKVGIEKVEYAFSDLIFQMKDIKYHEKNGQVKSITFYQK